VNDAEDALAPLQEEQTGARIALREAKRAAEACDPAAANAALATAREAAAAVERDGPRVIETAKNAAVRVASHEQLSARAASLLVSIEELMASMPSLIGQTEAAAALAQQPLDDGACGDSEDDETDTTGRDGDEVLVFVEVIVINFEAFPTSQFHQAGPDACDFDHWHAGQVVSLTGVLAFDREPGGCGFGKIGEVTVEVITVSQEVIDDWEQSVAGQ